MYIIPLWRMEARAQSLEAPGPVPVGKGLQETAVKLVRM